QKVLAGGVGIPALELILVGERDRVNQEVQASPLLFDRLEHGVEAGGVSHVAGEHEVGAERLCQRRNALLQRFTLIGESQLRPVVREGSRDPPGEGALVRHSHDEALLAGHQRLRFCHRGSRDFGSRTGAHPTRKPFAGKARGFSLVSPCFSPSGWRDTVISTRKIRGKFGWIRPQRIPKQQSLRSGGSWGRLVGSAIRTRWPLT